MKGIRLSPAWHHALIHAHAKHHGYCKVCLIDTKPLYHCGNCMTGVYCSSECQSKDIDHPCLIGAKGGKKKRQKMMDPLSVYQATSGMLAKLPPYVINRILSYLTPEQVRDARLVSKYLKEVIGPSWIRMATWEIYGDRFDAALDASTIPDHVEPNVLNIYIRRRFESPNIFYNTNSNAWVFPNIINLRIEDYYSRNLEWLVNYQQLQTLEIIFNHNTRIWGIILDPIATLTNLETLNINIDFPLTLLRSLTKLKKLSVGRINQDTEDIFNNIQSLHVGFKINPNTAGVPSLDFLSTMPKLTTLTISNLTFNATLNGLLECQNLKYLKMDGYNNRDGIFVISQLTTLTTLMIKDFDQRLDGMLKELTNLEVLSIGAIAEVSLNEFAALQRLEKLILIHYRGDTLDGISSLKNLKTLNLNIYTGSLEMLKNLPKLAHLSIVGYNAFLPERRNLLKELRLKILVVSEKLNPYYYDLLKQELRDTEVTNSMLAMFYD